MSLFLPYEKMWDMPLGGESDEKQVPHWAGNIIYGFLAAVFKVCFRYRVDGREKLRGFEGKSGVLVVSNHTSFLDVAFMYLAARPNQWIRFLGREDLFDNAKGLVGQILSRVGAFPIKRDSADRSAIKRATRMLKNKGGSGHHRPTLFYGHQGGRIGESGYFRFGFGATGVQSASRRSIAAKMRRR